MIKYTVTLWVKTNYNRYIKLIYLNTNQYFDLSTQIAKTNSFYLLGSQN
ncbi:hypothetical protein T190115A13A_150032 [Tenacibaculum sp. 190524A02b]|uniref:Uncharacterized protein n=1 Tax=Tenacibaculum vairaonense TaxID=3137860 RepID=A0ABP1F4M4_9FLAO